jgi:hypothetical protein
MPGQTEKYVVYAPDYLKVATAAIEHFFGRVLEAERSLRADVGTCQLLAGSEVDNTR